MQVHTQEVAFYYIKRREEKGERRGVAMFRGGRREERGERREATKPFFQIGD
jgi:hypothetical protein